MLPSGTFRYPLLNALLAGNWRHQCRNFQCFLPVTCRKSLSSKLGVAKTATQHCLAHQERESKAARLLPFLHFSSGRKAEFRDTGCFLPVQLGVMVQDFSDAGWERGRLVGWTMHTSESHGESLLQVGGVPLCWISCASVTQNL